MTPFVIVLVVVWGVWNSPSVLAQRKVCPRLPLLQQCPEPDPECQSDIDCRPGTKCCADGCGDLICEVPVKPTGCTVPLDLALLIDSSGSISRKNWKKTKQFVQKVMNEFEVSEKGTHAGIIVYSSRPKLHMKFNDFQGGYINHLNYQKRAASMPHQRGFTFIDKALVMADTQLFTAENGMRKNVQKVALVVTDGQQTKDKGPFLDLAKASKRIKDKGVVVYALGVGMNINVFELLAIASGEEQVYRAFSFDELVGIVNNITAEQCKACTSPIDIIFGLPTSTRMSPSEFTAVKDFTKSAVDLLEINNRLAHVSFIPYSDGAEQIVKLDSLYSKPDLKGVVDRIQQAGSGYNIAEALARAADNGFTIFGGTRPTAPKILVLLVPESTSSDDAVLSAAEKLKSQGVKLITVKIGNKINSNAFKLACSQPSSKHFFDARSFSDINDFTREAIDSACKAKNGKCPVVTLNPDTECPADLDNECELDADCEGAENTCCRQQCGFACMARIRNCMIPMDVGIAIDNSQDVSNSDFQEMKNFAKQLVYEIADAENNIHFGLMTFSSQPKTEVNFKRIFSQSQMNTAIDKLVAGQDSQRRIDRVLRGAKNDLFSLEGGVRQGHPRRLIILTSGKSSPGSEPIEEAAKDLDDLEVTRVAIGINRNVDLNYLRSLASENRFAYRANQARDLISNLDNLRRNLCEGRMVKGI